MGDSVTERLEKLIERKQQRRELDLQIAADEAWIANSGGIVGDRTIEEHLLALAPQEGFDISEINDRDRREIARVTLDAYMLGTAWLTRVPDAGFKREDPLRISVHDRRLT